MDLAEAAAIEAALEKEKQEFLVDESKQALVFLEVNSTAATLLDAGIETTLAHIAEFGNMFVADVEKTINWFNKSSPGSLPFTLNETREAKSDLAKVMAGLTWIANRRLDRCRGRNTPPLDRSVLGLQKVIQVTGFEKEKILSVVQENMEAITKRFADFRLFWIKDDATTKQEEYKRQEVTAKLELIREAIMDISKGRIGTVTAEQIANWHGGQVGLEKRAVDRYLSEHPSMRDLDKFRVIGRTVQVTQEQLAAQAVERRFHG